MLSPLTLLAVTGSIDLSGFSECFRTSQSFLGNVFGPDDDVWECILQGQNLGVHSAWEEFKNVAGSVDLSRLLGIVSAPSELSQLPSSLVSYLGGDRSSLGRLRHWPGLLEVGGQEGLGAGRTGEK